MILVNPLTAAIGRPFFGPKLPAARARKLFTPSTDSASLLVEVKANVFSFSVWRFLEVTSQWGHVLKFLATFTWPWALTHWPILLNQSFLENYWGLWVQRFSPIFVFLSIILATDMLESH